MAGPNQFLNASGVSLQIVWNHLGAQFKPYPSLSSYPMTPDVFATQLSGGMLGVLTQWGLTGQKQSPVWLF